MVSGVRCTHYEGPYRPKLHQMFAMAPPAMVRLDRATANCVEKCIRIMYRGTKTPPPPMPPPAGTSVPLSRLVIVCSAADSHVWTKGGNEGCTATSSQHLVICHTCTAIHIADHKCTANKLCLVGIDTRMVDSAQLSQHTCGDEKGQAPDEPSHDVLDRHWKQRFV